MLELLVRCQFRGRAQWFLLAFLVILLGSAMRVRGEAVATGPELAKGLLASLADLPQEEELARGMRAEILGNLESFSTEDLSSDEEIVAAATRQLIPLLAAADAEARLSVLAIFEGLGSRFTDLPKVQEALLELARLSDAEAKRSREDVKSVAASIALLNIESLKQLASSEGSASVLSEAFSESRLSVLVSYADRRGQQALLALGRLCGAGELPVSILFTVIKEKDQTTQWFGSSALALAGEAARAFLLSDVSAEVVRAQGWVLRAVAELYVGRTDLPPRFLTEADRLLTQGAGDDRLTAAALVLRIQHPADGAPLSAAAIDQHLDLMEKSREKIRVIGALGDAPLGISFFSDEKVRSKLLTSSLREKSISALGVHLRAGDCVEVLASTRALLASSSTVGATPEMMAAILLMRELGPKAEKKDVENLVAIVEEGGQDWVKHREAALKSLSWLPGPEQALQAARTVAATVLEDRKENALVRTAAVEFCAQTIDELEALRRFVSEEQDPMVDQLRIEALRRVAEEYPRDLSEADFLKAIEIWWGAKENYSKVACELLLMIPSEAVTDAVVLDVLALAASVDTDEHNLHVDRARLLALYLSKRGAVGSQHADTVARIAGWIAPGEEVAEEAVQVVRDAVSGMPEGNPRAALMEFLDNRRPPLPPPAPGLPGWVWGVVAALGLALGGVVVLWRVKKRKMPLAQIFYAHSGSDLTQLSAEAQAIQATFLDSSHCDADVVPAATIDAMLNVIQSSKFRDRVRILLYAGHANGEGIFLKGEAGSQPNAW